MALKVRMLTPHLSDSAADDPLLSVQVQVYDDVTGLVVSDYTHSYSGKIVREMADADALKRVQDDALAVAWDERKRLAEDPVATANLALVEKLASSLADPLDIPAKRPGTKADAEVVNR